MPASEPSDGSELRDFLAKAKRAGIELADYPAGLSAGLEELAGGELAAALEHLRASAALPAGYRGRMGLGLVYPALVAALASIGVVVMASVVSPVYASMYGQVHEAPGPAAARLARIERSAPLWLVVVPAAVVAGAWWLRREPKKWFSGASRRPRPLAAWAAEGGDAADLQAVESLYASLARERANRWTLYGPLLATVVVGGGATLLYALTLFTPLVELLGRLSP